MTESKKGTGSPERAALETFLHDGSTLQQLEDVVVKHSVHEHVAPKHQCQSDIYEDDTA